MFFIMKLKIDKNKRILFVVSILILLSFNIFLMNLSTNQNIEIINQNDDNNIDFHNKNLKLQDLASDNTYSGIGTPWNVTHWANRTDYDLVVGFENNSFDIVDIPLGSGWEGYKLKASIKNLYDARDWCNGTFHYGTDDVVQTPDDDTDWIENSFQNWSFTADDIGVEINPMSGNYLDNTFGDADGHDCLELRIDGDWYGPPTNAYFYDGGDKCWWNSIFKIPRGRVIDSEFQFDVKPNHLMEFNDVAFVIYLNNEKIYSKGAYDLNYSCGGENWKTFKIPMGLWTNTSNIFTDPINNSVMNIKISLEQLVDCGYDPGFINCDYQQLFIDNIKLNVKTEVKPSQIQLKMNNKTVNDIDWGKGTIEQSITWTTSPVQANFTSDDIGELGGYTIDLKTDLNLYARKDAPETNYETNTGSLGTMFSVSNNSMVNWEFYSYFAVPTGYEETEMRLEFPTDVNITWVSEPQDPNTNRLNQSDYSTQGLLIILVNTISTTPDGFWKFEAISPNYYEQLDIYNNVTGEWLQNNTFLSGDYINITGKITDSPLITDHIQQTKAQLHIRFPNGTIWTNQNQLKSPNANGYVYFDYFEIPISPPNYEVGEYEAILTWNNSYSTYGLNETGIIYKKFTVIHKSILLSDQNYYDEVFEGEIINLKVSFNDEENFDAIQDAIVYLDNFNDSRQYFSEISPGYYFLEFNTTGGSARNNTLTIYANSSLYINNRVNVTIELIQQTVLTAKEYPTLQVIWNNNFTIHLNYTEKSSGTGISTIPTTNWIGNNYTVEGDPGLYNITCNSSAYEVNKIHSLIINADKEGYESQSIIIGIFIIKRQTNMSVYVDSLKVPELFQAEKTYYEVISISGRISDTISNEFLAGEVLTLISENYVANLTYTTNFWYNISIPCSPSNFSLGLNLIDIRFIKDNYDINIFTFQLLIKQIEIDVDPVGFEDSFNAEIGETINVQIELLDPNTNNSIENAYISYTWDYGYGTLNETTPGTYQAFINLPENLQGNYKFNLIITPEESTYKTTQYSFIVVIGDVVNGPQFPNYLLWIIIGVLVSIVSALGVLSLRSYVFMPRKRRKESELLTKTQRFKDLKNIQAIVIIHKLSGIPLYSKSYSILEKHKKELFSGFIQAITTIGEEFSEREITELVPTELEKSYGAEKIIELDFKQFYCLITDIEDIRVVFILKERSSERLKSQVSNLALALNLKLSKELEMWDGSLDDLEIIIPKILNEYFELYYKDSFKLARDLNLIKLKKEKALSKMEMRVINVVQSMSKDTNIIVNLNNIVELVSEENKDLVIVALESLIRQNIIIPIND